MASDRSDDELSRRLSKAQRRAVDRISHRWYSNRPPHGTPQLQQLRFAPDDDIYDVAFLLIADRQPQESVFVLAGPAVETALGTRAVGRKLNEVIPAALLDSACAALEAALTTQQPARISGAFRESETMLVLYRLAFFPVAGQFEGTTRLDYLLGTYGCRREPAGTEA
jgi:hypothetical protein